jgi:hypothetical protein
MKYLTLFITVLFLALYCKGQPEDSVKRNYDNCLDSLKTLVEANGSFKKAVFLTENCYLDKGMQYEHFERHISQLVSVIKAWQIANPLISYHFSDSSNFETNYSIFKFLKDTTRLISPTEKTYYLLPYTYDFDDFSGLQHWTNMFVTKLLSTHKGNCHSLPYLYKILADELGANCWLALAPNHTYISNRCMKIGWYNTELTSGTFPIDAWIMASGYLPVQAVQNGIYMDTLSNQQSIALCILDLAKGYEHRTKIYNDEFILKCCDLSLQYFPLNVQAMLLKAETLKHVYEQQKATSLSAAKKTFSKMEALYLKMFDFGYREMPDAMYIEWLQSVMKEREKYTNKQLQTVVSGN